MQSQNNLLPLPSVSPSKMSGIQKLGSHIRSALPDLHGTDEKVYVYMRAHNSFQDSVDNKFTTLKNHLEEMLEKKIEITFFRDTQ
jgi:hypothetical protein